MPVYCLEGVGGSGKSLYLLSNFIIPWVQQGKHVYHNIEGLKVPFVALRAGVSVGRAESLIEKIGERFEEVEGELISKDDPEEVRYFYKDSLDNIRPAGSLIIIDEAQNYFNSRDFKNDYSRDLIDYLSRNRHYKHTVVWASQNIEGVDVTFRRQTQYIYFLERVGNKNYSTCSIYEGWMKNDFTKPYDKVKFSFPVDLFGCYDSYIKGSEGEEEHRETTNRWLHSKPLMIVIILFVIFVVFAIFHNPFTTIKSKAVKPKSQPVKASVPQDTATPPPFLNGLKAEEGAAVALACFRQSYIADGVEYFILNSGRVVFADRSLYQECTE